MRCIVSVLQLASSTMPYSTAIAITGVFDRALRCVISAPGAMSICRNVQHQHVPDLAKDSDAVAVPQTPLQRALEVATASEEVATSAAKLTLLLHLKQNICIWWD
eukprot:GHUV01039424.1.p2 GENE.GHUV01039424.1~~GHUV01039424.1.p2  ORF type:complete len:105 (+),score=24.64 GHUV01039424.1:799-1113(+)